MDVHGTRPLGVNWYRLLSIYSDLGKRSNSHEKICDIGTELQSFRADVGTAIHGINTKLDDLINATKIEISSDDLTRLKDDIVTGLKDHVQSSGQQCAAPVVCDGESVVFTEDVKELLSDLVRQKAERSLSPGEGIYEALGRMEECLGSRPDQTDSDAIKTRMKALQDTISNQAWLTAEEKGVVAREIASKVCSDKSFLFTEPWKKMLASLLSEDINGLSLSVGQLRETLEKFDHHGINKQDLLTALEGVQRELRPNGEVILNTDAVANAVAQKMSESDSAALKTALSEMFEEKGRLSASEKNDLVKTIVEHVWEIVKRPSHFNEDLNGIENAAELLKMFVDKDERLTIPGVRLDENEGMAAAMDYVMKENEYVVRVERYNSEQNITGDEMKEAVKTRYDNVGWGWVQRNPTLQAVYEKVDTLVTKNISDIGMIRYLHALLKKNGL